MAPRSILRPGVRRNFLVRRRLQLLADEGDLLHLFVDLVGFNRCECRSRCLVLEYDASRVHLNLLLERLQAAGVRTADNALNRFRLGWYRYLDSNIAANAADTSSTACSQSPLRHR
ncbi:hypothetical protein [Motiliproteus sediminis]|uniref:hypothetical protein n=1 Tax=Motiliproteus sediminis TaxID=1468178 RepID=UPI001AEFCBA9|nr:hypothetical protein [Motiliproteus sediminis]